MGLAIKGLILGFIIVLPGMSGGTAFLIMGIYEDMIKDLVKLNLKPYLPLIAGMMVGIFIGGTTFALFFENYRNFTVAFLLGCLLASLRSVLKDCPKMNMKWAAISAVGVIVGFYLGGEPMAIMDSGGEIGIGILVIGGALACAAMIIPGIPGSSVLILLGIYGEMLISIKQLDLRNLVPFLIGSFIGAVSLVKILEKIYDTHHTLLSYFFAGLILGSSRAILPNSFSLSILLVFLLGFGMVWFWSGKN